MKQQLVFRIGDIRKNLEYYHMVQIIPVAVATRDEGAIMRGSARQGETTGPAHWLERTHRESSCSASRAG